MNDWLYPLKWLGWMCFVRPHHPREGEMKEYYCPNNERKIRYLFSGHRIESLLDFAGGLFLFVFSVFLLGVLNKVAWIALKWAWC